MPNDDLIKTGIVVCIPVFNDWHAAEILLQHLDSVAPTFHETVSVIFVDDGSTEPAPMSLTTKLNSIHHVQVLELRRNVGHQRAIALGLAFIQAICTCQYVVVMDGDGEDDPTEIARLLECCRGNNRPVVVFAKRGKRSEGLVFRIGYLCFRSAHWLLTGRGLDIGNFSVIPATLLNRVVGVSEIWIHYAAGVIHAQLPVDKVPIPRKKRLSGKSKMNITSLVTHGLSAISVSGETVGVRVLGVLCGLMTLLFAALLSVVYTRLFTDLAVPGWATNAAGLLSILLVNLMLIAIVFVLSILQARNNAKFLPIRDWEYYIASRRDLQAPRSERAPIPLSVEVQE